MKKINKHRFRFNFCFTVIVLNLFTFFLIFIYLAKLLNIVVSIPDEYFTIKVGTVLLIITILMLFVAKILLEDVNVSCEECEKEFKKMRKVKK